MSRCSFRAAVVWASLFSLAATACESERSGESAPRPARVEEGAPQPDRAREVAERARDALAARLMGRVGEAVAAGGHASAVHVCREEAVAITRAVGEEHGVKIGRVSKRMRSAESHPPPWVEPMIESEPGSAVQRRDEDGSLQVVSPIFIAKPCLACHGAEHELAPGVKSALERLYPDDEATGYSIGDLRGWFWIEVPSS